MRIGVAQIQSGADPYRNLLLMRAFIDESLSKKVELLCFPENLLYRGPKKSADYLREDVFLERDAQGRLVQNSPFSRALAEMLEGISLTLSLGSVFEKATHDARPFNSHWVRRPDGIIHSYSKIHLFDYDSNAGLYRESAECLSGNSPKLVQVNDWNVGLSICYDLRFPELFRELTLRHKAELLLVPAAFTRSTGEAHWHSLLRARAIENLSFVAAAGQWGSHLDSHGQKLYCFGHSLIISPWGEIIAEGPREGDALLVADLDRSDLLNRRSQLPALQSAKLFQGMS